MNVSVGVLPVIVRLCAEALNATVTLLLPASMSVFSPESTSVQLLALRVKITPFRFTLKLIPDAGCKAFENVSVALALTGATIASRPDIVEISWVRKETGVRFSTFTSDTRKGWFSLSARSVSSSAANSGPSVAPDPVFVSALTASVVSALINDLSCV